MKYQVLFSLKNNETIIMNVVCCSRDWHFKGLYIYKWIHYQEKQLLLFSVLLSLSLCHILKKRICFPRRKKITLTLKAPVTTAADDIH